MQSPNPFIALSVLVAVSAAGALPAAAESNGYRRPQPAQASQTVPSDSASPSLTAEQPDGQPRINQPVDQRVSRQSDLLDQLQTESEIRQQLNQSRFRTSDRPLSPETDALRYEQEVQQQINLQNMRTPSTSPSGMLDRLQFEQRVRQRLQTPPSSAPESPTPRETAPTQLRQELAQATSQGDKPQASQAASQSTNRAANQPASQAASQSTNRAANQPTSQPANQQANQPANPSTRPSGQATTSASHSASQKPSATSTPASSSAASTPAESAPDESALAAAPEPATELASPAVVSAEPAAKPAAQPDSVAQPAPATPESTTASTPNPNSREARQARLEARREARRQARREAAAAREAARAAQTSVAAAQPGEVPSGEVPSGEAQPSQAQADPQTRQAEATEPQTNQPQTRESQVSPETPAVSATPSLEVQPEARETETSRAAGSGQPETNEAHETQASSSEGEPRAAEAAEAAKATNETPRAEAAETERAETQPAATESAEAQPAAAEVAEAERAETKPAETEPAETEPAATESAEAERAETKPAATEPAEAERTATTEPAATESTETESTKTELAETEPAATESAESTPEAAVVEAASEEPESEAAGSATKPEAPTERDAVEAAQSPTMPLESQPLDLPGDAPAPSEPPRAGDPGRSDRIDPGENIFSADDFSNDAAAPDYLDPDPNPLSFPTEPDEVEIVGTQPITLRQAIQLALRNNPDLRQAQFELERSQADLRRSEASNLPTLDALGGFTQSGTETGSTVPDSFTSSVTGEEQPNVVTDPDNPTQTIPNPRIGDVVRTYQDRTTLSVGIELNYSIFTSGQRPALIRAAERQVRLQQLEVERQTEQLILDTVGDYYNLQQAGAQVNIFRANLDQAEQSLRDAQALERAGVGTRFDVLQAEVDVANARQRLTQQLSDLEVSQRQISQRLNISQSLDISAGDPIEVAGVWDLSLEESIVEAFKNRAELEQQLVQREIAEQNRRAALADLGPQVGFQGAFNVSSEDFELNGGPNYNYSLALNARMRLFDGGEARSRANAQESNISIAEAAFEVAQDQIRFDIERGYSQLNASFTNIQTTALAVEQATEALRLARLRFQAGVGTQTDVLRQQAVLAEAQVNNLTAILDYNRALAVLQRGVSNYPEGFLNEQP
ncbi:MAG: TolC family protein [Elainella sp.]